MKFIKRLGKISKIKLNRENFCAGGKLMDSQKECVEMSKMTGELSRVQRVREWSEGREGV